MMENNGFRYLPGKWFKIPELDAIAYRRHGVYDPNTVVDNRDITHRITREELNSLISFLFEGGYIKPQLGENREEDIKIIHRLIDIAEKCI